MARLPIDDYFLQLAFVASQRGTCVRRQVGCILVNERNQVLSTGYNGVPAGMTHCTDKPCAGATAASGTKLDACEAIHAEQNALLQCPDIYKVHTIYCTDSPCMHCVKLLANTPAKRLVFAREYPHQASRKLWEGLKREWVWHRFEYPFTIGAPPLVAVPLTPIEDYARKMGVTLT
jgi:dCMP deaminase